MPDPNPKVDAGRRLRGAPAGAGARRPGRMPVEGALRELAGILSRLEPGDVVEVFEALLTPQEREKIALRWKLVCLLEQGETQRHIASALGVSLCKITRGSHELKYGPAGLRKAVRKVVSKG